MTEINKNIIINIMEIGDISGGDGRYLKVNLSL